jgi:phosphoketolase
MKILTPESLEQMDAYWRAANYLSFGRILLDDNPLLKRPLTLSDVKHILPGHGGTTSGQNFILVMDTIDRLPQTGDKCIYFKQQLKDKLIEHKQYINKHGQDLPEVRNWKWEPVL